MRAFEGASAVCEWIDGVDGSFRTLITGPLQANGKTENILVRLLVPGTLRGGLSKQNFPLVFAGFKVGRNLRQKLVDGWLGGG